MPNDTPPFRLDFLDHIALRVKDLTVSTKWYREVLGLVPHQRPEWGEFPVLLLCGKTGLALFPARTDPQLPEDRFPDHFAFHLAPAEFRKAQAFLASKEIAFTYQGHHYFESIYLQDPDGHTVELTTPMRDLGGFYMPYPVKGS